MICYITHEEKRFCVQIYENKSCERSTFAGNSALLPSDVIDFALLPAQRFWRETVSLLDVMWPWSNQWEHALLGKGSSCLTTQLAYPGNKWWFFLFLQGNFKPVSCVILFTYVQIFTPFSCQSFFGSSLVSRRLPT